MRKLKCDTCRHGIWLCDCYCGGDGYDPSIIKLLRRKIREGIMKMLKLREDCEKVWRLRPQWPYYDAQSIAEGGTF